MKVHRRVRWADVRAADDMVLDFEITRDEWMNRLVFLGRMTPEQAERHALQVEGAHAAPAHRSPVLRTRPAATLMLVVPTPPVPAVPPAPAAAIGFRTPPRPQSR